MAKLMLVEDDNNLREIYGARLMAEGYEIVSASDGEEALALAVKEKPDLIISDVMMPKISGFDMLDILRTTPETKNTKVIMMTALSQPEDRQRGESLGADKYLVKSQVTLEDVVSAVHEMLGDGPPQTDNEQKEPPAQPAASAPDAPTPPPAQPPAPSVQNPSTDPANQPQLEQPPVPPPAAPEQDTPQQPQNDNQQTQTPDQNKNDSEEGTDNVQQPPDGGNTDPKADGADDAPEPASKSKKIIKPLNDLSQDKDHLMQLAAEEEALEAQKTPGAAIGPPGQQKENEQQSANDADKTEAVSDESQHAPAPTAPQDDGNDIAQTMAAEKAEMEEEVKELLEKGVIDEEANAPTVGPQMQEGVSEADGQQPAETPPETPPEPSVPSADNQTAPPEATEESASVPPQSQDSTMEPAVEPPQPAKPPAATQQPEASPQPQPADQQPEAASASQESQNQEASSQDEQPSASSTVGESEQPTAEVPLPEPQSPPQPEQSADTGQQQATGEEQVQPTETQPTEANEQEKTEERPRFDPNDPGSIAL